MDKSTDYDAVLETFKRQQVLLEDKQEQLNKYLSEHQDAVVVLEKIRKDAENDDSKRNEKKHKFNENMQWAKGICLEIGRGMIWEQVQQKHNELCESKTKINVESENGINKFKEASKDLRQLENERKLEIISSKMEDYRNERKNVSQIVGERSNHYQKLNIVRNSDYQISLKIKEQYKTKGFTKSVTQINEETEKIKRNIQNIYAKAKELAVQNGF